MAYVTQEDTVKIFKEFKEFIARGNVMDLAVAVVMGAAFTAIINALVTNLITPLLSLITGGYDFSQLAVTLGSSDHPAVFAYGAFIQAVINFLAIAAVIFIVVKVMNKLLRRKAAEEEEAVPTKSCPYCAQEIPESAVRCPQCTTILDISAVPQDAR